MTTIIKFARPEIDFSKADVHFFIAMRNQPIGYEVVVPDSGAIDWATRPFGTVTISGDVEAALPHILAWIDPEATVIDIYTWREAITEALRNGVEVNLDTLPAGVLRHPGQGKVEAVESDDEPATGLTHASMVDAAACAALERRTGIDKW